MTADLDIQAIREALGNIPEDQAQHGTEPPRPDHIYVVSGHERALNPDTSLVVGDRGTGKSFWSAALSGETTRQLISRQFPRLNLDTVDVCWGFASGADSNAAFPTRRVLVKLIRDGFDPEDIWRAVILHQLCQAAGQPGLEGEWRNRVTAIADDPEMEENRLAEIDRELTRRGRKSLVVFDGLDRLAYDWPEIRKLLQGLLKTSLEFRGFKSIRLKLFMRPDMWEDRSLWAFPDASKLQHSKVMLEWRRADLYGLIWHWLANDETVGENFRSWCKNSKELDFKKIVINNKLIYSVPQRLRSNEDFQKKILDTIASPYMGRDRRRGKTYTWVPLHLADAKGQVSPRSFMLAMQRAAQESRDREAGEALHYDAIKRGVQKASTIRLQELEEDYPWIGRVRDALSGMTVPCTEQEMKNRLISEKVVETIRAPQIDPDAEEDDKVYLPPHALEERTVDQDEEDGVIAALIEIGVLNRLQDGRLNMPDLFRVGAGIGRKGGVKPVR